MVSTPQTVGVLQAVSGDFLGLQSDSNLVEVDALMALLSILSRSHPRQALLVLRFFAFRKMLGCGVCKYYGSPMWRSFDALAVHYFTQPLVNRRSCWAHRLPAVFHQFSVLATFVVEVILPFLIWSPWPCRIFAWIGFNSLNAMINTTGNYGFISFLNTMENLSLLDDRFWSLLGIDVDRWRLTKSSALLIRLPVVALLSIYVILSLLPLARASKGSVDLSSLRLPCWLIERLERLETLQQPWKLVNYQGKFSGMHDFRWEPLLEASVDGGNSWRQIRWRYKLNQGTSECGVVLWLHLPRLDWRVWFLPLGARRGKDPPAWYMKLLERLAACDEEVLKLLDGCPFSREEFQDPDDPKMWVSSRLVACEVAHKDDMAHWNFRDIRKQTTMDFLVKEGGVCETAKRRRLERA